MGLDVYFTLVIYLHDLFFILLLTMNIRHIDHLSFIDWREIHRRALEVGKFTAFDLSEQVLIAGVIVPEHIGLKKERAKYKYHRFY